MAENKPRKFGKLTFPSSKDMYVLAIARSKKILESLIIHNKHYEEDEFYYLEVLDRSHVILCTWEDHIDKHHITQNNEQLKKKSEEIINLIGDFYQLIANVEEKK